MLGQLHVFSYLNRYISNVHNIIREVCRMKIETVFTHIHITTFVFRAKWIYLECDVYLLNYARNRVFDLQSYCLE